MGSRCVKPGVKADDCEFRMVEVIIVKKSAGEQTVFMQVVNVDNHPDTLRHVWGNWNDFVVNIIKVKKMEESDRRKGMESADIFGNGLQLLFSRISESASKDLLTTLSKSLKKALILMAIERYAGDTDTVCTVLGINRAELDQEMSLCGVEPGRKRV